MKVIPIVNQSRQCGSCTVCCEGHLIGEAYGHDFFPGKPCHYLGSGKCTIYPSRPITCQNYYCAWIQGLFPDWMKPTESNVLISVEKDAHGQQYFKVMPTKQPISEQVIEALDLWSRQYDTYYMVVK